MKTVKKTLYVVRMEDAGGIIHYSYLDVVLENPNYTHIDTIEVEHIDPDTVSPRISKVLDSLRQQRDELNAQIEALEGGE